MRAVDFFVKFGYNSDMFENVYFNGQFRDYQQRILDRTDDYLKDGKIHIVAAPGSGKTILGLELIRTLGEPCLILAPTTTIRNQWGDRFCANFLHGQAPEDYVSYDLKNLKPITSVTYQALHSAYKRLTDDEDGVDVDFAAFDLIGEVKRRGVKTVCLDEAHHLQNEWQKALEAFLIEMKSEDVKIIALTATPPYDAKPAEWNKYIDVCGEIDEEIFVPELVRQNSLCPHQDYIYFNYPTEEETASFGAYRRRAAEALDELINSNLLVEAHDRLCDRKKDYDFLYTNTEELVCLLTLFDTAGFSVDKKLIRTLTCGGKLPKATTERLTVAVNYLANGELLDEYGRDECMQIFKRHSVTERGEIQLDLSEKLKRSLISSTGKLKSIAEIVRSEHENRRGSLRMLILTDYIKKDNLTVIGSELKPDAVSVVSVFEMVRRTGVSVAALSGSLVILPSRCADILRASGADFTCTPLGDTDCSSFTFRADNREKVRLVSSLFEKNEFSVLVGTKSLLGEGWDAPCVNSLILASFVGSFMLSNQMRGRAIRTDGEQPDKTANIWHLVTLERPALYSNKLTDKLAAALAENKNSITSCDYETVTRRFDCFVAPNYDTGEIESGIARITVIKPPYDETGVKRINEQTLRLSRQSNLKTVWKNAVGKTARLSEVSDVPKRNKVPPFLFINILYASMLAVLFSGCVYVIFECFFRNMFSNNLTRDLVAVAAFAVAFIAVAVAVNILMTKILRHLNPQRSIKTLSECVMLAMQDAELISRDTRLCVDGDDAGILIQVELKNASVHDQNLFHTAIQQMLSPIENPRYLLIPLNIFGNYRYRGALACPDILGSKNEYAALLADKLKKSTDRMVTVYTRTESGRRLILKCRNKAYITENDSRLYGRRKHVSKWN